MNLALLNRFMDLLIKHHDYIEIPDSYIRDLVHLIDAQEQFWHVEGKNVWSAKAWREALENKAKRLEQARLYREALDKRRAFLDLLTATIVDHLGLDEEMSRSMALTFMKKGNTKAMIMLGMPLEEDEDIPELPCKHEVWENGKKSYDL